MWKQAPPRAGGSEELAFNDDRLGREGFPSRPAESSGQNQLRSGEIVFFSEGARSLTPRSHFRPTAPRDKIRAAILPPTARLVGQKYTLGVTPRGAWAGKGAACFEPDDQILAGSAGLNLCRDAKSSITIIINDAASKRAAAESIWSQSGKRSHFKEESLRAIRVCSCSSEVGHLSLQRAASSSPLQVSIDGSLSLFGCFHDTVRQERQRYRSTGRAASLRASI